MFPNFGIGGGGKTDLHQLSRPYTVEDTDPKLKHTISKATVDTVTWRQTLFPFSRVRLDKGILPSGTQIPRAEYHEAIVRALLGETAALETKTIVFVGGGYGAGKTTTLSMLSKEGQFPFDHRALLGVDYCKLLIPEFDELKSVADGRASEVCQSEAREISDKLFEAAVAQKRSFAWDSSMSNFDQTIAKITAARAAGYELKLIGVWTPVEVATVRAMERARQTRRFAHPDRLGSSAKGFARNFSRYFEHFDQILLFFNGENTAGEDHQPRLIAEKESIDSELAIDDECITNQFLEYGKS